MDLKSTWNLSFRHSSFFLVLPFHVLPLLPSFFLLQTLPLNPNKKQLQTQIKNNPTLPFLPSLFFLQTQIKNSPRPKSKSIPRIHNISYNILPFLKHFSFPPPPQGEAERKREAALLIVS